MVELVWETVEERSGYRFTVYAERCKIPGGWLVRTHSEVASEIAVGLTFVPDPDHTWV